MIINIQGGPEGQSRPGFGAQTSYFVNELGVAVRFPNVRGSTGYGKTFLKLDNGFLREVSYRDIGTLIDWIKQNPELDGNSIMVTGGSYGGHMTWNVATRYDDEICCRRARLLSFGAHLAKATCDAKPNQLPQRTEAYAGRVTCSSAWAR